MVNKIEVLSWPTYGSHQQQPISAEVT
jgi:hypothetical protein